MIFRIIKLILVALPALGIAGGISVQSGANITLNGGAINLGCNDVVIAGNLDIGSGTILNVRDFTISGGNVGAGSGEVLFAGNWSNSGSFTPGMSEVTVQDGCSKSTTALTGDTDFYAFTATSGTGKTLQAAAGSTQTFSGSLTLQGLTGNPLLIRSSEPGNQAHFYLDPIGSQSIFAVDVRDNTASLGQWLAPGPAVEYMSVDSGNNVNWFLAGFGSIPVPSLSNWALIVLTMGLMTIVLLRRRVILQSDKSVT